MITREQRSDRVTHGERTGEWPTSLEHEFEDGPALWVGGDGNGTDFFEVPTGWTRIGRSPMADLRLDHPSVSRRHAVLIRTPDDELRVIDDRSLNGTFVNDEQVEWAPLGDGDELTVGCFRLVVVAPEPTVAP